MRNLTIQKKLRGIPRRIRALRRWASSADKYYPSDSELCDKYWNYKIPVMRSMVEGKHSTLELKSICAQELINATHYIFLAKPKTADTKSRVTCCICIPEMFSSEICIFNSDEYFKEHTTEGLGRYGKIENITGKSIIDVLGLIIPDDFKELGIMRTFEGDDGIIYTSEHWYIGEVC